MIATDEAKLDRVRIPPALPLALLESVRAQDRPLEILEDEDVTVSLPRRLGLSDVVFEQIRRYQQALDAGRKIPLAELMGLLKLVLRRPDAATLLHDAGRRYARWRLRRRKRAVAATVRALPRRLMFRSARRAARKLMRGMIGAVGVSSTRPFDIRLSDSLVAGLHPQACALYTGALHEVVLQYGGDGGRSVAHAMCKARGDDACQWIVEETSDNDEHR